MLQQVESNSQSVFQSLCQLISQSESSNVDHLFGSICVSSPVVCECQFFKALLPHRKPFQFKLPHSCLPSHSHVSLIVPNGMNDSIQTIHITGDPRVTVLEQSELGRLCDNRSQQHQFWKSIDAVMLHWDLWEFPSDLLGRIQTQKQPVWLQSSDQLKDSISEARHFCVLPRRGNSMERVIIGHSEMTPTELWENLCELLKRIIKQLDNGQRDLAQVQLAITVNGKRTAIPIAWQDFHSLFQRDIQL